jgi:hypothetical protein
MMVFSAQLADSGGVSPSPFNLFTVPLCLDTLKPQTLSNAFFLPLQPPPPPPPPQPLPSYITMNPTTATIKTIANANTARHAQLMIYSRSQHHRQHRHYHNDNMRPAYTVTSSFALYELRFTISISTIH